MAPPDLDVTIVDGVAVVEAYTATLVQIDGSTSDVTSTAVFSTSDTNAGTWSGASLSVGGGAAGPIRVIATVGDAQGDTGLTIHVKGSRVDGAGVPGNASDLFGSATETAGLAPSLVYPADNILVPPNLGEFDVHWQATVDNLFEISLQNQYVDLRIYKSGTGGLYTTYTPAEWYSLGSSRNPLTLTVAGMQAANPTAKGTSVAQTVNVTNEIVVGGMYYWTTTSPQGIYRYDMSTPSVPPSSFFPPGTAPTSCMGCHGLSKDGSKIAITLDSGDGRGSIFNVGDRSMIVPIDVNPQYWNFATFTPDASKLVTVYHGAMSLRASAGGAILSAVPNNPGLLATHPELSPDGTRLANVETTNDFYDFQVSDGTIVTRTFDGTTFGPIQTLVANAPSASNYYPSWSPDGQWIAFTRTVGNSYNDPSAEIWVVKADGTQPPIQLNIADTGLPNLTNSWARWAPFPQTSGPTNDPVFYMTFSTIRPFGVRPTGGTQIWMTPFYPNRAGAGMDPSGPAFRMPFQQINTANHIAQWTEAVVIGRKADGSPLTQAEAVRAGTFVAP